jgi:hypothetical protein
LKSRVGRFGASPRAKSAPFVVRVARCDCAGDAATKSAARRAKTRTRRAEVILGQGTLKIAHRQGENIRPSC